MQSESVVLARSMFVLVLPSGLKLILVVSVLHYFPLNFFRLWIVCGFNAEGALLKQHALKSLMVSSKELKMSNEIKFSFFFFEGENNNYCPKGAVAFRVVVVRIFTSEVVCPNPRQVHLVPYSKFSIVGNMNLYLLISLLRKLSVPCERVFVPYLLW